jgi:hypothetical protein
MKNRMNVITVHNRLENLTQGRLSNLPGVSNPPMKPSVRDINKIQLPQKPVRSVRQEHSEESDAAFGTHAREAISVVKDLLGRR